MADLSIEFAGIRSPNPFWLASGPPTNTGAQIRRAFEAGWGGVVWKTIGTPVLNVSNRYGAWSHGGQRMLGINNVELISDRPLATNLKEIREVKRAWPDRALIVSAMVESKPEAWAEIVRQIEDTGADGIELNYGCPHGMNERGMGSAVGQVPEYCEQITGWVKQVARIPVIVKLTPNVTDIALPARAAVAGNADAIALINTLNSIIGVDLETFDIEPSIAGRGSHGGYAGPAIKPIALHMLGAVACEPSVRSASMPISAMGGISTWRDAAEFLLMGAGSLQVCTAVMHHGFRIIDDLCDGLTNWMDSKGFQTIKDVRGKSLSRLGKFNDLDLSYRSVARIDPAKCIRCNLCFVACNDVAHQCIDLADETKPIVREDDCVGCRLCANVCPVDTCIEMVEVPQARPSITWGQLADARPDVTTDWAAMEAYRKQAGIDIH